jgi:hypothetical protein
MVDVDRVMAEVGQVELARLLGGADLMRHPESELANFSGIV